MEEREKILQKIKNKRIKALRRLAHQRNISDPILSDGVGKDIINDYFDRGSTVYAPVKRAGKNPAPHPELYDVSSRTVPLDNIGNILSLEYTIPRKLVDTPVGLTVQMSKSMPVGAGINMRGGKGTGGGNYRSYHHFPDGLTRDLFLQWRTHASPQRLNGPCE